jgi:hypothetical protein
MEIESRIKNIVQTGKDTMGTVVLQAFEGAVVKITVEVEVRYDPENDSIPMIKASANDAAILACESFVMELKEKGYL